MDIKNRELQCLNLRFSTTYPSKTRKPTISRERSAFFLDGFENCRDFQIYKKRQTLLYVTIYVFRCYINICFNSTFC